MTYLDFIKYIELEDFTPEDKILTSLNRKNTVEAEQRVYCPFDKPTSTKNYSHCFFKDGKHVTKERLFIDLKVYKSKRFPECNFYIEGTYENGEKFYRDFELNDKTNNYNSENFLAPFNSKVVVTKHEGCFVGNKTGNFTTPNGKVLLGILEGDLHVLGTEEEYFFNDKDDEYISKHMHNNYKVYAVANRPIKIVRNYLKDTTLLDEALHKAYPLVFEEAIKALEGYYKEEYKQTLRESNNGSGYFWVEASVYNVNEIYAPWYEIIEKYFIDLSGKKRWVLKGGGKSWPELDIDYLIKDQDYIDNSGFAIPYNRVEGMEGLYYTLPEKVPVTYEEELKIINKNKFSDGIVNLEGFQIDAIKDKLFSQVEGTKNYKLYIDDNTFNADTISGRSIGWEGEIKNKAYGFIKIGEDVEVITKEYYNDLKKRVERLERKIK